MFRADPKWLDWWTVFYWGWFIGYAPMVALYVARISRGRTIREIIMTLSIIAPLVTMFWFTVVGGTGIGLELQTPGIVT
ncbi:BCCT family transporter, partial [Pantoea sp. SIMBA_079]